MRDYLDPDEADTAAEAALLGGQALDICLNGATLWRCVPSACGSAASAAARC